MGLDKQGKLHSWSVLTGKKYPNDSKMQLHSPAAFTDYEVFAFTDKDVVYSKGWYDKILLKKKTPVEGDINENEHFDPQWFSTSYVEN